MGVRPLHYTARVLLPARRTRSKEAVRAQKEIQEFQYSSKNVGVGISGREWTE